MSLEILIQQGEVAKGRLAEILAFAQQLERDVCQNWTVHQGCRGVSLNTHTQDGDQAISSPPSAAALLL